MENKWKTSSLKLCISYVSLALLVLLSSVSTILFLSPSTYATSDFDGLVQNVDSVILQNSSCSTPYDMSVNWSEIFSSENGSFTGGEPNDWQWVGGALSQYTDIKAVWDNKERWGVSQIDVSSSVQWISIWFTDSPLAVGQFSGTLGGYQQLEVNPSGGAIKNVLLQPAGDCSVNVTTGDFMTTNQGLIATNSAGFMFKPFFAFVDIDFPPGYEGETPVDTAPGPGSTFTPEIGYNTTTNNEIMGLYIGDTGLTLPAGFEGGFIGEVIPFLKWTVYASDGTTVLDTKTQNLGTPYSFLLPGNDTYYLEASFTNANPPALPILNPDELQPVRFKIVANGTFVIGSTVLNECTETGSVYDCGEANPLEDCSTYGLDVGGYIQCAINNFGIWLRNTLINLFVPRYSFYSAWVSDFNGFLQQKLGFVYTSFATVTGIFTGIITSGATSECAISAPGTIFGATFAVDVCTFEGVIGSTPWGLLQGLVISVTVIALVFAGYRKYLEVVDHR